MKRVLCISRKGRRWKVHWEKEREGDTYGQKGNAILVAKRRVAQLPEGAVAEIRVQKTNGTFQTVWTYGKDAFPPE